MLALIEDDPAAIALGIAARARARRLELNLTQQAVARRSGLSVSTYRRFESTGEVGLRHLILIAVAFGMTGDFDALFSQERYASLDEVIDQKRRTRQRGRRHD
jgi:transcriptional regulator with XRE-family HTH domain